MRVAALSVRVGGGPARFTSELSRLLQRAKWQGANLVVLPELAVLGLADWKDPLPSRDVPSRLEGIADRYVEFIGASARQLGMTIVGGSHVERRGGCFRNVSLTALPTGDSYRVEKQILTQWESQEWGLEPGEETEQPPGLGVLICYDAEFPELARPMAAGGTKILCVPSYTETRHGFQRVRWSCQARAIENQVFVVHASLCGSFGHEPVPSTYGSSAILTPSVPSFPESAVLASTPLNRSGIAVAELDFDALDRARESGDVRNWHDFRTHFP